MIDHKPSSGNFTLSDLAQARRAIVSTLAKSEKAVVKLKPGTWQERRTREAITAYRIAITLIDNEPHTYTKDELTSALASIGEAKRRVENVLPKFAPGTAQHTLALRRIAAFSLAEQLITQHNTILTKQ